LKKPVFNSDDGGHDGDGGGRGRDGRGGDGDETEHQQSHHAHCNVQRACRDHSCHRDHGIYPSRLELCDIRCLA
jgi:hypothetical protein